MCLIWNQGLYGEEATSVPRIPSLGSGAFLLLLLLLPLAQHALGCERQESPSG